MRGLKGVFELLFEFHCKDSVAFLGIALCKQISAMQPHYLAAQAQSDAVAMFFGAVEGEEYILHAVVGYAVAVVGDGYLRAVFA